MRRSPRIVFGALGAVLVIVVALIVFGGGDEKKYEVKTELTNALGLRDGSLVTAGGVEIGKVDVSLAKNDKVLVTAKIDEDKGPVGKDAKMYITSVNLLGQKRLEVVKGDDKKDPAPSGTMFSASKVTESTDLDEILAVLKPDTRARLNVLINEAGGTVAGRSVELSDLINQLPRTIAGATQVVDRVTGDNARVKQLVTNSDKLVADLSAERTSIGQLVDSAGQSAESAATKRAELQTTINRAPVTLSTLQRFLGELEQTTVPLGPAARDIKATAPQLRATLAQIKPFQKAAKPTLDQAEDVAPDLTRLATGATPVIRRTTPTVVKLNQFVNDIKGVSATLEKSSNNLIGTVDNWSRAVQYRDNIGHIFRGEAGFTPQTFEGILGRYMNQLGLNKKKKAEKKKTSDAPKKKDSAPSGGDDKKDGGASSKLPSVKTGIPQVDDPVNKALDGVGKAVDGVSGAIQKALPPQPQQPQQKDQDSQDQGLLDYLLKP